jgi:hypothetical protein
MLDVLQFLASQDTTQPLWRQPDADFHRRHDGEPEGVMGAMESGAYGIETVPISSSWGGALNFRRVLLWDTTDKANVFAWAEVVANIPGLWGYVVGKPWVYKRRVDGFITSDVCIYVDDGQSTGKDEETAWRASSKFAKAASFMGLQDAARKRMAPSQDPEPWFGAKVSTTEGGCLDQLPLSAG